ncbi:P-loop containing nucleoside triphosphate hydrolase protein, partial [Sistotremastrum suecicum HHB10207 ss-3]
GKDALIQQIRTNDTVVILEETGSGETAQVPQLLLEPSFAKDAVIGVTQTRRVAATSIAQRVALEQGTKVGDLVGYSVRFEEASSSDTKIKFLTDGMLVRELMMDPLLSGYSVIIVDEAHNRTLGTDLLLSRLKDIQKIPKQSSDKKGKRPASETRPLKVVMMSATLDAEEFSAYFNGAKIFYVQGRQYPVKIYYTSEPQQDFLEAGLNTFFPASQGEDGRRCAYLLTRARRY